MRSQSPILRRLTPEADSRTISAIGADGERFPVGKMEAHSKGLLHDAVSVFIFDGPDMLLQRRSQTKYHCGGQWANACCTHPDWGEESLPSARRRLREELGINLDLTEIGQTTYRADVGGGLTEHETVRIYRAEVDRSTLSFDLDPDEVSEVSWLSLDELTANVARSPWNYTPWLRIYLERWDTLGLTQSS